MPQTVPNRPMKGPGRAHRRQHQEPALQPLDLARDGHVHHLLDAHLQAGKGARLALEAALPFPHRGHEQRRHRLRRLGGQRFVEFLQRLARPERLLEPVHAPAHAGEQQRLVDRDRPHPDRADHEPDHHRFDEPVRLPEQAEQRGRTSPSPREASQWDSWASFQVGTWGRALARARPKGAASARPNAPPRSPKMREEIRRPPPGRATNSSPNVSKLGHQSSHCGPPTGADCG